MWVVTDLQQMLLGALVAYWLLEGNTDVCTEHCINLLMTKFSDIFSHLHLADLRVHSHTWECTKYSTCLGVLLRTQRLIRLNPVWCIFFIGGGENKAVALEQIAQSTL